jgi:hypothetical protein
MACTSLPRSAARCRSSFAASRWDDPSYVREHAAVSQERIAFPAGNAAGARSLSGSSEMLSLPRSPPAHAAAPARACVVARRVPVGTSQAPWAPSRHRGRGWCFLRRLPPRSVCAASARPRRRGASPGCGGRNGRGRAGGGGRPGVEHGQVAEAGAVVVDEGEHPAVVLRGSAERGANTASCGQPAAAANDSRLRSRDRGARCRAPLPA